MGTLATLARAALPAVPVVNLLPGIRKAPAADFTGLTRSLDGVRVSRDRVEAYADVCGFARRDTAPVTYPHVLAFGLHLAIMADPAFPYPAIGTVHLENSLTSHRPVAIGETLSLVASVGPGRAHPKGTVLDVETSALAEGEVVWESTSRYLRRGPGAPDSPGGLVVDDAPTGGLEWRLPADLGRRYAAVSGDHNPIHLYPLTARALGFRRQIAHGMWTKARCLAALENRLPDAVGVEVAFKRPVLLPGRVAFAVATTDAGATFALTDPRDGSPHLLGRATGR